jgi:subtilase family serine protease
MEGVDSASIRGNVRKRGTPFFIPGGNSTQLETHALWALEVALDVEVAHAMAPMANILTTRGGRA